MQQVIIEKPYRFVPPSHNRVWPSILHRFVPGYMKRKFGVGRVECHGIEHLRTSLAAGHGVLLTPNHCRPCDPFVIAKLCQQAGCYPYVMASWHLFHQSPWITWLLRRGGVFSVYREGMDRAAVAMAMEILEKAARPLVLFPEGVVTRSNDHLNALMEGTAFIARGAAKKRAKTGESNEVVVHPVALRYLFDGDIRAAVVPVLDEIEARLTWRRQGHLPLVDRVYKIGEGLLSLKETEYLGKPQAGEIPERLQRLIDHLLSPLEDEWLSGLRDETTVARVKKLRAAVLPDIVKGELSDSERQRRWLQLADMYLAQQISCYPPDYLRSEPTAERLLETVERFEEDLTDKARVHAPIRAVATIGEAITVSPERERGADGDPLMARLEERLWNLLEKSKPNKPHVIG